MGYGINLQYSKQRLKSMVLDKPIFLVEEPYLLDFVWNLINNKIKSKLINITLLYYNFFFRT
jgi:hypothetical protein